MFPNDKLENWYKGKGHWNDIPDHLWYDWKWQMRNCLKSKDDFLNFMDLTEDELVGFDIANNKLSVAVTPYFFNLVNTADSNCPVRRQVIPSALESNVANYEKKDPVGEEGSMPVPGIVHRYPDRVLFLVTDRCASYCRYCTRSRMVSNAQEYGFSPSIDIGLQYIQKNKSIRDVLLSGGDPLLLSNNKLDHVLSRLREIDHIEFVRIGSRVPVFLPQRINDSLLSIFKKQKNLWLSIHVNHPKECTDHLFNTCRNLSDAGIPLGNQSVLLKGINDNSNVMKSLIHRLLMMKVKPYYLYQCDLIEGSSHLRVNPQVGLNIIHSLRGHTTGYAIPQFVIDAPGGGGKIPLNPEYVKDLDSEKVILKNYQGNEYTYNFH